MKKILATLGCLIASTFLLTSCLEEETVELSPYASITSFSINDISTVVHALTDEGKDTTKTIKLTGSRYLFSIDHNGGRIYNQDSLPKGTDITKVTVNIGYEGSYIIYGEDSTPYYSTDSIDFSSPVLFSVYAANGEGARNYYIQLNVHKSDIDSLTWHTIAGSDFAGDKMQEQKALIRDNTIHVFAQTAEGLALTSTPQADGKRWSALTPATGITGNVDMASIQVLDGSFYLLADGTLHHSADGIHWETHTADGSFDHLVATADNQLWAMRGDKLLAGTIQKGWEERQTIAPGLFPTAPAVVTTPLKTNEEINRTMLVGVPADATAPYATVWSKLSTEPQWTHYNEYTYGCPALKDLQVVCLHGNYYAFGGKSLDKQETIGAFEAIYTSTDGGITWTKDKHLSMPAGLAGFDKPFSCVVDDNQTIWLMCSGSNTVYRGRMENEKN